MFHFPALSCERPPRYLPRAVHGGQRRRQQPHAPPLHPRAKSASHMPAKAAFPNNGKQLGGKAGSAGAMAMCQRRARPFPEAAACCESPPVPRGVEVGANGPQESCVPAFRFSPALRSSPEGFPAPQPRPGETGLSRRQKVLV